MDGLRGYWSSGTKRRVPTRLRGFNPLLAIISTIENNFIPLVIMAAEEFKILFQVILNLGIFFENQLHQSFLLCVGNGFFEKS